MVYGVAIGGLFALVFAVAQGRLGRLRPRATAAVLALLGFLAVYAVPFLKYPANPPAVQPRRHHRAAHRPVRGHDRAVGGARVGAVVLRERLLARLGGWNATLVAAAAYAVLVGIAMAVLPVIAETPADFPATVLYDFRLASFAGQLVLWAALGLIFGVLVERNGQYAAAATAGRPEAARLPGR